MKVKSDHRSKFSNLSNWKEEALKKGFIFPIAWIGEFTAIITLHFHLQPQYKYELFHINFAPKPNSLYEMYLQEIMVVVFLILD